MTSSYQCKHLLVWVVYLENMELLFFYPLKMSHFVLNIQVGKFCLNGVKKDEKGLALQEFKHILLQQRLSVAGERCTC